MNQDHAPALTAAIVPEAPPDEVLEAAVRLQMDRDLPERLEINAFGQKLTVLAPQLQFLRSDSLWRLRHIYQPALGSQNMAGRGVALDIGAGFGAFALPFACAFPDWQIFCFEPDQTSFDALRANILDLKLANIIALPCAIGYSASDAPLDWDAATFAVSQIAAGNGAIDGLADHFPMRTYSRALKMPGYVERGHNASAAYETFEAPTIAGSILAVLAPRLLKLVAPMVEKDIVADLKEAALDNVIGESWAHVPAALVNSDSPGLRQTWIPRAGAPMLGLRRSIDQSGRVPGLDVVIAAQNPEQIEDNCIADILRDTKEIRALFVISGAQEPSDPAKRASLSSHPRMVVLTKLAGNSASAWNFGRMHSNRTHIAFFDVEDTTESGFFAGLLDLSRNTGAEAVQGGYRMRSGEYQASEEASAEFVVNAVRHELGHQTCCMLPSHSLMEGETSIWRRIHRRDFLDNRKIWFPEHMKLRAEDVFQMLTLHNIGPIPMLDDVHYLRHDKSRPDDIGEDSFYVLEVFRIVLKRAVRDGWNDFTPVLRAFIRRINQTAPRLKGELRMLFLRGAAELWIYARKTFGFAAFRDLPDTLIESVDFAHYANHYASKLKDIDSPGCWAYLDALAFHPPLLKAARA